MSQEQLSRQAKIIMAVLAVVILVLLGRLGYLTLLRGQYYAGVAREDYLRVLPIQAARGKIVDSRGRVIAGDRIAWAAFYLHSESPPPAEKRLLCRSLDMKPAELQAQLQKGMVQNYSYQPILLKSDLTLPEFSALMVNSTELPGVRVTPVPAREYPNGDIGGHVLGYVGTIPAKQLNSYTQKGYQRDDVVGLSGLEAAYEPYLRGQDGAIEAMVDRQGRLVRTYNTIEPKPGDTVHLTIDWSLERTAQAALEENVKAIEQTPYAQLRSTNISDASVVVMNVYTGNILAMVSLPPISPNRFAQNKGLGPGESYFDGTTEGLYAPGSIFKPIMAIGALTDGVVTATTHLFDPGYFPRDPQFKNWYKPGFGSLDIVKALAYSDDVFFYYIGEWMHLDRMQKWIEAFGLNQLTGIDLPGEAKGIMPSQSLLEKWEKIPWTWGQDLNTVIGQGLNQYTPVELIRAEAAVANGGTLYRPHLVSSITSPTGQTVRKIPPQVQGHVSAPASAFATVRQGMIQSAQNPKGTGYEALQGLPISLASKTGTAETSSGSDAFFVTYGPTQNPQIVILVYIRHGVWGADAGNTARAILDQYFHLNDPQGQGLFQTMFGLKWPWPYSYPAPKAPSSPATKPAKG